MSPNNIFRQQILCNSAEGHICKARLISIRTCLAYFYKNVKFAMCRAAPEALAAPATIRFSAPTHGGLSALFSHRNLHVLASAAAGRP